MSAINFKQNKSLTGIFAIVLATYFFSVLLNAPGLPTYIFLISAFAIFLAPGILISRFYLTIVGRGVVEWLLLLSTTYIVLGLTTTLLHALGLNATLSFSIAYSLVSLLIGAYYYYRQHEHHLVEAKTLSLPISPVDISLLLVAFFLSLYIHYNGIPFFTTLNTDALAHITAIKEIFSNGHFSWDLRQVSSTFTVVSYLPIFHLIFGPLLSVNQALSVPLYNMLDILFVGISGLFIYNSLAPHNRYSALVFVILHFFAFERIAAYTSHFLLPQTLCAFIGIVLIINLIYKSHISWWMALFTPLLLIGLHFLIGTVATLLFFFILFFRKEFIPTFLPKLLQIAAFYFLCMVILTGTNYITYFKGLIPDFEARVNELAVLDIPSFIATLLQMYGVWCFLIPTSLLITLFSKNRIGILISIALTVASITILVQVPYSGKLLLYIHYLSILLITWTLDFLHAEKLPQFVKYTSIVLLIASMVTPLYISSSLYKNTLRQDNYYGLITTSEIELQNDLSKLEAGTIISDPLSMSIFEATTQHSTLGGVYTAVEDRKEVWNTLNLSPNKGNFANKKNKYLVITYRTKTWQKQEINFISKFSNEIWEVPEYTALVCSDYSKLGTILVTKEDACIVQL